jgi:2-octaprenyl-6-methoxyphenol hydroxylase
VGNLLLRRALALLPLRDLPDGRHRSALVWTVPEKDAKGVTGMSDAAFVAEVAKRMDGLYGKVELSAPRMSYPLSYQNATRITGHRLALVGDAAHGMHPIAGQGLNLACATWARWWRCWPMACASGWSRAMRNCSSAMKTGALDNFTTMSVMDGIVRLFGVPGRTASAVRRLGMGAVQRMPTLKRFFMNEARGMSGTLPSLLQGLKKEKQGALRPLHPHTSPDAGGVAPKRKRPAAGGSASGADRLGARIGHH